MLSALADCLLERFARYRRWRGGLWVDERAMIKITHVVPLDGFMLRLSFNDGTEGVADLKEHLAGFLEPLNQKDLFERAFVEDGSVKWSDELDLASEFLYALAHKLPPPRTEADVASNELQVGLRELRKETGMTQTEIAQVLGLRQGEVSRLETREDMKLSTLRKYVRACGGDLELVVKIGKRVVRLGALLGDEAA